MKPITIYVHKVPRIDESCTGHIRITPEAEMKVRELQRQTGLSARQIVSQIIVQSADTVEVVEVE